MTKSKFTLLILLIITAMCGTRTFADTSRDLILQTSIPTAVSVTKTSSTESQTANPKTGNHGGLSAVFNLLTNGDDNDFDFIMSASTTINSGTVSAFGNGGRYIVFTHLNGDTTSTAVDNAKIGGNSTKNAIAYPFHITTVNPVTASYRLSYGVYGECYQILMNEETETAITVAIDGTPISGTYSMADESGTYQATVTLTAVGK